MTCIGRPSPGVSPASVIAVTDQAAVPPSATLAAATESTTSPFLSTTPWREADSGPRPLPPGALRARTR